MEKKPSFPHIIIAFLCAVFLASFVSCGTVQRQSKPAAQYSKKRTRYQPNWNHTTSQNTTYHIRRHNTRRSQNH